MNQNLDQPSTDRPRPVLIKDSGGTILAMAVPKEYRPDGVEFLTPTESSLQVGLMTRPTGEHIPAHRHLEQERSVFDTQEVLFIRNGKLRVHLFDKTETYVASLDLTAGDLLHLHSGGHSFDVSEELEMIEIKQGPFIPKIDKVRFEAPDFTPKILPLSR